MFDPPRCPHRNCPRFRHPRPGFYRRHGSYRPGCRSHAVPRFLCKSCGRTFSRQTFRMDYRDHRPDLNARLFQLLASGLGLRQSARLVGLSQRCTELKFRKLARHLRYLNSNVRGPFPREIRFQLDELETYETRRSTRPLSVPVLIEAETRFVVWAESAPIRPRGNMPEARRRAIAEEDRRLGRRRDRSRRSLIRTLARGARLVRDHERVVLETDEKSSYGPLARKAFGAERLDHRRTNSKLPRTTWNPLFPINHTEAMARDLMGRLRRESWLVSKQRRYLDLGLAVFAAYRNFVRRRFNRDRASPAELLGIVPRRLRWGELLGWRQDWGRRSVPLLGLDRSGAAARATSA